MLRSSFFTHPALNFTALLTLVGAICALIFYSLDPRELLGVSVWEKPLKFFISAALYSATFSWLYSYVDKGHKLAKEMGNLIAFLLLLELVVIVGLASAGLTSHFNVSTPFHVVAWSVMAVAISLVWGATFVLGIGLWATPRMSPELQLAVRWALVLGLAGMGIAFTMTSPQPQQVLPENWVGIAGAHTVGAADGGPGLPFFGWSTEAGDLRVSHFFGLHALQVIPLVAIMVSLVFTRYPVRLAIIAGVAVSYTLTVAFTYVQALQGQTVAQPFTLVAFGVIVVMGAATAGLTYKGANLQRATTSPRG